MVYYKDFNCLICGKNEESEDKNTFKTSGLCCKLKSNHHSFQTECLWCEGCVLRNLDFSEFYNFFQRCNDLYMVLKSKCTGENIDSIIDCLNKNRSVLSKYPFFFVVLYTETEFTFIKTYLQTLFLRITFNLVDTLYDNLEKIFHSLIVDDLFCLAVILFQLDVMNTTDFDSLYCCLNLSLAEARESSEAKLPCDQRSCRDSNDKFILISLTNRFVNKFKQINYNSQDLAIISGIIDLKSKTPLSSYKFYFSNKHLCNISSILINDLNDPGNVLFHPFKYNGLDEIEFVFSSEKFKYKKTLYLNYISYFLCQKHSKVKSPYSPYDEDYFEDSIKDKNFSSSNSPILFDFENNTNPLSLYFNYIYCNLKEDIEKLTTDLSLAGASWSRDLSRKRVLLRQG